MSQRRIQARFKLDAMGKPRGRSTGDYEIELSIAEVGPDVYGVTYELDASYYDAIRDVRSAEGGFAEMITSYGDYSVKAKLRTTSGITSLRRGLYEALVEQHGTSDDPDIRKALQDIHDN